MALLGVPASGFGFQDRSCHELPLFREEYFRPDSLYHNVVLLWRSDDDAFETFLY